MENQQAASKIVKTTQIDEASTCIQKFEILMVFKEIALIILQVGKISFVSG